MVTLPTWWSDEGSWRPFLLDSSFTFAHREALALEPRRSEVSLQRITVFSVHPAA